MKSFKQFFLGEIILTAPQHDYSLGSYVKHITDEKPLGRFEDFMVYQGKIDNKIALVARTDDDAKTFIGYAIGEYQNIGGKKHWCSNYTYFDKKFRGKGHATAMIQFILRKLGVPIVSDKSQSPDGRKLWQSLMKKNKHKVYDHVDKKFIDFDDVPSDKLYSTDDKLGERYSLVLEEVDQYFKSKPSLIFHEHVIYTNPINRNV